MTIESAKRREATRRSRAYNQTIEPTARKINEVKENKLKISEAGKDHLAKPENISKALTISRPR
jgi:hypothetical protein